MSRLISFAQQGGQKGDKCFMRYRDNKFKRGIVLEVKLDHKSKRDSVIEQTNNGVLSRALMTYGKIYLLISCTYL